MMHQPENQATASRDENILFSDGERTLTYEDLQKIKLREFSHWNFDEDIALLTDTIEALEAERSKLAAIVSGNFEGTKLIDVNLSGPDFSLALADGPIPYLVEYLAQMLGHRQLETPLNYSALDLTHREFGAMVLTLQRKHGKSPQIIAADHLAKLKQIQDRLSEDALGSGEAVLQDLGAYLSALPSKEQS